MIVTVTRTSKGSKDPLLARYRVAFDRLPGRTFEPWRFAEMVRDLRVSTLLDPFDAWELVNRAGVEGSASTEAGGDQ